METMAKTIKPLKKFIVLSSQRSGSTLLCELLDSHPGIHVSKELFKFYGPGRNFVEDRFDPRDGSAGQYLEKFYVSDNSGLHAKGFKLMLDQLRSNPDIETWMSEQQVSVIHLERTNLLKQYVSRISARGSGIYHTEKSLELDPLILPVNNIVEELERLHQEREELRHIASRHHSITLTYEDLVGCRDQSMDRIHAFLEIDRHTHLDSPLVKILKQDLNHSVLNYHQIHSVLSQTPFVEYCDPVLETDDASSVSGIFIHVPKVAGTSIEAAIFGSYGKIGHLTAVQRRRLAPEEFARLFKFGFVRNPYDRFVSAYEYMRKGGRNRFDEEWAKSNLSHHRDFESFVLSLRNGDVARSVMDWMHFRPQYEFLCGDDGNILVDFVGRYENMQSDFQTVASRLCMRLRLPHLNPTMRNPYQGYYSPETREIVRFLYMKDLEIFGYEF